MKSIMLKDRFYETVLPTFDRLMLVGSYGDCYEIHENPTKELVEEILELHRKQTKNNPFVNVGGFYCLYDANATKAIRFYENWNGELVIDEVSGESIAKKECDFYL